MIELVNGIIFDYQQQGYTLTLRQLYYQLVARDHIENSEKSYKRIGNLVSDGRLTGLIDWDAIEDRTRALSYYNNWSSPTSILRGAAKQYQRDLWEYQPFYCEVWVEKEALAGVVERACSDRRVPHFSCRGYVSQSEMYTAANRLHDESGRVDGIRIIHLGDHDPSGIDMSRDIQDRLRLLMGDEAYAAVDFQRIALNYDQISQYNPPPNPAKTTDSRFADYQQKFGRRSWELDALEPSILVALIQEAIEVGIDDDQWDADKLQETQEAVGINAVANRFNDAINYLKNGNGRG